MGGNNAGLILATSPRAFSATGKRPPAGVVAENVATPLAWVFFPSVILELALSESPIMAGGGVGFWPYLGSINTPAPGCWTLIVPAAFLYVIVHRTNLPARLSPVTPPTSEWAQMFEDPR